MKRVGNYKPGPLKKGQVLNPNGRPKGAKGVKTLQWEALGESIIGQHAERFNECLANVKDERFMEFYIKILGWFKPQLSSASAFNLNVNQNSINLVIGDSNIPQFPDNVEDDDAGLPVIEAAALGSSLIQDAEVIEEVAKNSPDVETPRLPSIDENTKP